MSETINESVSEIGPPTVLEKPRQVAVYGDANKCKACRKCEIACIASHNNMTQKEAMKVRKNYEPRIHVIKTDTVKMPVQCRQCVDAPCVAVCPTEAIIQAPDGQIHMRSQLCAGCSMCVVACPYGAMSLAKEAPPRLAPAPAESEEGTQAKPVAAENAAGVSIETGPYSAKNLGEQMIAYRCDLCEEWREKKGKDTYACVEACPFDALHVMDVADLHRQLRDGKGPAFPYCLLQRAKT